MKQISLISVNLVKSIFAGPSTLEEARGKVTGAIEGYALSVAKLGTAAGLQLLTYSRRIEDKIDNVLDRLGQISLTQGTLHRLSG